MAALLGFIIFGIGMLLIADTLEKHESLKIDLPEEIHLTKTGDTLKCIRRNDSLIIEFKP